MMNTGIHTKSDITQEFDSLSFFHHIQQHNDPSSFDHKLQILTSLLQCPKDYKLEERFAWIKRILSLNFGMELLSRLGVLNSNLPHFRSNIFGLDPHHLEPLYLLHLWCLMGCTDSIEYIARYLEITPAEVEELIRELHHTFSIETLLNRVRQYYHDNQMKSSPYTHEYQKKNELLGLEFAKENKDITEGRKQRLKRKYGGLATQLDLGIWNI